MLQEIIKQRLEQIEKFMNTFQVFLEPSLPIKFRRGPVQKKILKIHNLPCTGPNMRSINEAIEKLGYRKTYLGGQMYFSKQERRHYARPK